MIIQKSIAVVAFVHRQKHIGTKYARMEMVESSKQLQPQMNDNVEIQDGEESGESQSEQKNYHREKLNEDIWEQTDYAKASALDKTTLYDDNRQNGSEGKRPTTHKKSLSGQRERKKSSRRKKSRRKERKEKELQEWRGETESLIREGLNDENNQKERKRGSERKKMKPYNEMFTEPETDIGQQWWKTKKCCPTWQNNSEVDRQVRKDDLIDMDESLSLQPFVSTPMVSLPPVSKPHLQEDIMTARYAGSMESTVADELYGPKSALNYENVINAPVRDSDLIVELRYWAVLALFILLVFIYRSFLPPVQCDTKFKQ